jgi:hypothetical protein
MQLLFYLLTVHHILPGSYYNLPEGEKVVVRAIFEKDMDRRLSR